MPRRSLPLSDVAIAQQNTRLPTQDWYDFFRELSRTTITTLTYGTTIQTDASAGDSFTITATNGTAFAIAAPTNPIAGQVITYTIRNSSGGALGAVTWDSVFKFATVPGPPTSPANGSNRSVMLHFDGTSWIERFRSAGDVPN